MAEFKEHAPGTFCWVDLVTKDAGASKKFYSELMSWDTVDTPAGPDMVYTMLQLRGKAVGGLYAMGPEQRSQGLPPHWMSYIAVIDVDGTVEKAKSLGGRVAMEPADVFEAGRMALIQDPTGAVLAVWQAKEHKGALLKNEPWTICWNELMTRDEHRAGEFYGKLFGWTAQAQKMGEGGLYTMFSLDETQVGGMMKIQEEWGEVPPNWMVYFAVEDCAASVEKVRSLKGEIIVPVTHIPDVGRFAVIEDPQSAVFGIVEMKTSDS
ncbi:MAG: VOC family protein [Gemmatimonadota bacterium]|nr:MAG: VOC family protein [Gemmatimonadota bacterium]